MKDVAIRCAHTTSDMRLSVSENNMHCIQCGLIQLTLDASQAARVRGHCHCMPFRLDPDARDPERFHMTVDPSQVDLKGECIDSWLVG